MIDPRSGRVVPGFPEGSYYYAQQMKSLLLQFMAIFTGLQVSVGKLDDREPGRIYVPIHHGRPDRVVAAIKSGNTRNRPLRVPLMAANISNISVAHERMVGTGQPTREVYTPLGGVVPTDTKVVHQVVAVPYDVEFELNIYTSNNDQQWQILEQILMLFDRQLQIQTSDGIFDKARITVVDLVDIRLENNYPISQDKKIDVATLRFEVPFYLSAPADIRKDFIQKIFARVGVVSTISASSQEMIAELDAQGLQYEEIVDISDEEPI